MARQPSTAPLAGQTDLTGSGVVKRSLVIAGHSTSVSLEDAFWRALRDVAAARQMSMARLIGEIDRRRNGANLSSAIRVFVLEQALAARTDPD